MRLLAALAVACVVFASTSEATYAAQSAVEELSAGAEMQPPGADMEEADVEGDRQTDHDAELKEREDEEEAVREAKKDTQPSQQRGHDELGESMPDPQNNAIQGATEGKMPPQGDIASQEEAKQAATQGTFQQDVFVNSNKQTLRVGSVWGMPGLYSSDGAPRDMSIGVAGGKRVYFGTAKNDAWIEATTGHMWLKGSITVKNYAHFFAEKQRLRVGAAWGMPGLYASDGGDRDMVLGTAAGKKIYFGVHRQDAWIEAGAGHMWLKGSLTVKNYGHFLADGQRLRVGAVFGMPGLYASDGANRDLMLGTAAGKKIYFGLKREDAWVEAGTGNMWTKGKFTAEGGASIKMGGKTLTVGASYSMPGIYAGDAEADDVSVGVLSGRKVYFGVAKQDAFVQAGTGNMWLKGSLTTASDTFVGKQKLRIGSVEGMPGIYASDGEARDMMLGTESGRKIYFGKQKTEAWIQAGTGDAFLKGKLTAASITVSALGQKLRVGEYAGMPGLYSSDDGPRDMIIGVADGNKVYVGKDNKDSYFTAGTGNLWLKGTLETHGNNFIYSEGQRLRVGSVDGIPGIYSSDGAARDLMLGTAKNSKVFFGDARADAWVQAGTGNSFFKGAMEVTNQVKVTKNGQTLLLGESFSMPGIYSSTGAASDLMLGCASGKKVHFGYGAGDAYITAGTGDAFFKGTVSAKSLKVDLNLHVKKAATFDDTVTVNKNLILKSSMGEMNMAEEFAAMKEENAELRSMMSELKQQMSEMMAR